VTLFSLLPTNLLSRWVGALARIRLPRWLLRPILKLFVVRYRVDLSEIEGTLSDYASLNQFFTRSLKREARPIDPGKTAIVSPVDGLVQTFGAIEKGTLLQAKGISYRLDQLLIDSRAPRFEGGSYLTLLLAPGDCHLVFSPVDGFVEAASYVPGRLFPVRDPMAEKVPGLYTLNERLISYIKTAQGLVAVIMVGAFDVGRMTAAYDPAIETNAGNRKAFVKSYETAIPIRRGDRLGVFNLGSTVILLFERGMVRWRDGLERRKVRYGERIADWETT
jgi:phosphatidylserine decarboxylase